MANTKHGYFNVTATGDVVINDLDFEPDYVVFRVSAHNTQLDTFQKQAGQPYGLGYGVAVNETAIEQYSIAHATGSDSVDRHTAASSAAHAVLQPVTDGKGNNFLGNIRGAVTAFSGSGFTINFDEVQQSNYISYSAYKFEDESEVQAGLVLSDNAGVVQTTGFEPDYLALFASNTVTNIGSPTWQRSISSGTHGFSFGIASFRASQQVSSAISSHSASVDGHAARSSSSEISSLIFTDKNGGVVGRNLATASTQSDGFSLSYSAHYGNRVILYIAVKTEAPVRVGTANTPTTVQTDTLLTEVSNPASFEMIANNAIDDVDKETNSQDNQSDGHWGWTVGAANSPTDQHSLSLNSHSRSINGHAGYFSTQAAGHIIYADLDGNSIGSIVCTVTDIPESGGIALSFDPVDTSHSSVKFSRAQYLWTAIGTAVERTGNWAHTQVASHDVVTVTVMTNGDRIYSDPYEIVVQDTTVPDATISGISVGPEPEASGALAAEGELTEVRITVEHPFYETQERTVLIDPTAANYEEAFSLTRNAADAALTGSSAAPVATATARAFAFYRDRSAFGTQNAGTPTQPQAAPQLFYEAEPTGLSRKIIAHRENNLASRKAIEERMQRWQEALDVSAQAADRSAIRRSQSFVAAGRRVTASSGERKVVGPESSTVKQGTLPKSVKDVRSALDELSSQATQVTLPSQLTTDLPEEVSAGVVYEFDKPVELLSESVGRFYAVRGDQLTRLFPGNKASTVLHVVGPEDGAKAEDIKASARGVVQSDSVRWELEAA